MQTKLILHGGFTRKDNELNSSFFREFTKDIPFGGNVLLVFFASEKEDTNEAFESLSEKLKESAEEKNLNFIHASQEDFLEQLANADAVFFQGGNTNILLDVLKNYGDLKPLLKEKNTIAGSSAGAYALAEYGTAHSEPHMRKGLGVLPLKVVCHYESIELPPSETSLIELKEIAKELDTIFLKDCEWKVVSL